MANSKINFTVEQAKSNFKREISILEREGAVLLGAIQVLQDYLDYNKQNAAKIDPFDLKELEQMIIRFLRILSLIDVYQYFESKNKTISDKKMFLLMVDYDYSVRINKFLNDLKPNKHLFVFSNAKLTCG